MRYAVEVWDAWICTLMQLQGFAASRMGTFMTAHMRACMHDYVVAKPCVS